MTVRTPHLVFRSCYRSKIKYMLGSSSLLTVLIISIFVRSLKIVKSVPKTNSKEKYSRDVHGITSPGISSPVGGKNMLVVHIGPQKTGTTSIQDALAYLDTARILASDNFYYIGKVNRELEEVFDLRFDLIRPLLDRGPKAWFQPSRIVHDGIIKKFKQQFNELHASQNHNVIISAEEISSAVNMGNASANFYTDLQQMIPPEQYDVHFIIVYRRYLERLLSLYHFDNNFQWYKRRRWENWPCSPRNCGIHVQTFREFYHKMIKPPITRWDMHPKPLTSLSLYKDFKSMAPKNWSMHVYNTHHPESSPDAVVNLLCGMGNFTVNTCNYLRSTNSTNPMLNYRKINVDILKREEDKYVIDYALMGQEAHYGGSIHKNITRRQAELAFRKKFQEWKGERQARVYREGDTVISSWNGRHDMTIPLACLSQNEWNNIMSESEKIESSLVHEFYVSTGGKESYRREIQEIKESHALCNIDLDIMFHNDTYWMDFLDCLRVSPTVPICL